VQKLGYAGPFLISPGASDQLSKFLELNPTVRSDLCFVDASTGFDVYKKSGFGKLEFGAEMPKGVQLKTPDFGDWDSVKDYLSNVVPLSPKGDGTGVPEGVTLLGGTVVIRGGDVVYASADRLPGDYPAPALVLDQVEKKATA